MTTIRLENGTLFDCDQRPLWITRDSRDGALVEDVDVWHARPVRVGCSDTAVWVSPDETGEMASFRSFDTLHAASIPIERARELFATLPETDRECVWIAGPIT